MSRTAKSIILLISVIAVTLLNSVAVVTWLNKSLFPDFLSNTDGVHLSFYSGVSLVFLITLLIYSLLGTFTVSILVTDILFALLGIANNIKATERNEFITFSELKTITSPKELLSFVEIPVVTASIVGVVGLIGIILLQWAVRRIAKKADLLMNIKGRLVILAISFITLAFIYIEPNLYNERVLNYKVSNLHNHNPLKRAQRDGYLPSFIHTINPEYMEKPEQYEKATIDRIQEKYTDSAQQINKKRDKSLDDSQTILYLSESFIDPELIPDLLQGDTPTPFITGTREKNIGGTLYSQYIGGGTANIEWSLLTSFSLEVFHDPMAVTPYSDFYGDSKNHNTILSLYDNKKVAIHPYTAHLYKRRSTYDAIGFDDFLYLDHGIKHTEKLGTHQRVSDKALNKDIFRYLGEENVGLIHVLTMQNHSPYSGEIPDMSYQPKINPDILSKEKEKELYNYLQGLKASDEAMKDMIKEIEKADTEINILFYGDHFPSIFRGTEDQFTNKELHETPWFLYMNHGRSNNGIQMEGLSPAFFTTVLLREGNYYVTPFQALMDELLSQGIKRIGNDFIITEGGNIKDKDLPDDLSELISDYRMIVYDALFGENALGDDFFSSY